MDGYIKVNKREHVDISYSRKFFRQNDRDPLVLMLLVGYLMLAFLFLGKLVILHGSV